MYKILITDPIHSDGIKLLKKEKNLKVDINETISQSELAKIIVNYDALIVRSRTAVTKDILKKAKNLKAIARVGIGIGKIDIQQASRQGILVVNSPRGNVVSIAEYALGLILTLVRKIIPAHQTLQKGVWDRMTYEGTELAGKTLGIIGLGKTGSELAWRARAFNMNIIAYDPFVNKDYAEKRYAILLALADFLKQADIISLHVAATEHTRKIINQKTIAEMKNGVYIINCAHPDLIDDKALLEGIRNKKIAGAAIDVFNNEPNPKRTIFNNSKIITTPHLGGDTTAAKIKSTTDACQGIIDLLAGRSPQYPVNLPMPKPTEMESYKPYLLLTQQLGSFAQQITKGNIGSLEISFAGEIAKKNTMFFKSNFLLHLLKSAKKKNINLINAIYCAEDQGIRINENKTKETNNFTSLLTVKVLSDQEEHIISGTVMRDQPHLVRIDNFWIDIIPEGYILVTYHNDKPGVIGALGTLLGKNNINIAAMEVGRSAKGKEALMVTILDSEPEENIIKQIEKLPQVINVKKIKIVKSG